MCAVDGCDREMAARGYCLRHYKRWQRYDDPLGGGVDRFKAPLEERFWRYVKTPTEAGDCWLWIGAKTHGYGIIGTSDGRTRPAHRVSYEMHNGAIPDGVLICHHCDVRACVNPSHLYAGTHKTNLDDAYARTRVRSEACKRGHVLDGVSSRGGRYCRTCQSKAARRWYEKKRSELHARP